MVSLSSIDQFNIYTDTAELKDFVGKTLAGAFADVPDCRIFALDIVENSVAASIRSDDRISENSRCYFPHLPSGVSVRYGDLISDSGKVKSGCHDPKGMLIVYGPGIRAGAGIEEPGAHGDLRRGGGDPGPRSEQRMHGVAAAQGQADRGRGEAHQPTIPADPRRGY